MRTRVLNSQLWVPGSREEVFPFFAEVENLDSITPPWLHFQILTPDVLMRRGTVIEYRLRLHGIPIHWRTEITAWEPPALFVDEQRKGPYRNWVHEHRFVVDSGGTTILDHVEYRIPGGILEPWVYHLFVGPDLEKIFEFRREQLRRRFALTEDKGA